MRDKLVWCVRDIERDMDQYALAHTHVIHSRDTDDKMTKTALNEARKDPESDYTPCYPAAVRVVDAILASGMEATADVQMRLPAAGVAGTTIPSQTISVSESLCADPLLNRVKWELYLPAHRHEFITWKLSEMVRCRREALEARDPPPVVATSAGSKAPERLPHDSTSAQAVPEAPPSVVIALRGTVMKAWHDFYQLASEAWTLATCCAVFYMCIASFCTRKQIHWRAPPGGHLVLAVVSVPVLLSTVDAVKMRPFRDATANMWAKGKPSGSYSYRMAAGPDGSLYVLGGGLDQKDGDLFKLDPDTKEWHIIEPLSQPQGFVKPSARFDHGMVAVGSDLYVFGGSTGILAGILPNMAGVSNDLFRFSTTKMQWEQLDASQVSGSPPSARSGHGMVAVGSDLYVFGGGRGGGAVGYSNELFRFSTTKMQWEQLDWPQVSGSPPSALFQIGMVAVGSDLYVFGGFKTEGVSNEFFRFSTTKMQWEQLVLSGSPGWYKAPGVVQTMPSARSGPGMVAVGSDLYVFGGNTHPAGDSNELFRFSTTKMQWEPLDAQAWLVCCPVSTTPQVSGSPPIAQSDPSVVAVGSDLYVFGGYPGVVKELFRFSTTKMQWDHLDTPQVSGSLPDARSGPGMVSVGSDLYVFGGARELYRFAPATAEDSNELFRFSTTERKWEEIQVSGTKPSARSGPGMAAVGSDLYVFGGSAVGGVGVVNDLFRFSTTKMQWEQLNGTQVWGSPPSGRSYHCMVAVGSDLYVFGGSSRSNDLFRFSTTKMQWEQLDAPQVSGSPPSDRSGSGMVAVGSDLYLFGGFLYEVYGNSNEFFRFSTTKMQWEQLDAPQVSGSPPSARYQLSMVAVGSDLYVFGGIVFLASNAFDGDSNELFRFSTTELKWEEIQVSGTQPSERYSHNMVAVGSDLYSFGGTSGTDPFLVYTTRQVIASPASGFSLTWFTRVYDGDIVQVRGDADWTFGITVNFCVPPVPCSLTIAGNSSASSTIRFHTNSRIVCEAASGCTGVTMRHVAVACSGEVSAAGPLQISGAGAVATIEGVTFSDCVSVDDGGSIRAYNGATVKVSGTTFQRSSSQGHGGALALLGVHANTHISTSTFLDCKSALSGGAVSVSHHLPYPSAPILSVMKVDQCTFAGNAAPKGGALAVASGSSVTIQSSQFKDNTASQEGGAIDVTDSSLTVLGTTFIGNTASGLGGGALHVGSSKRLDLAGNTFTGNTAPVGGGGAALWQNGTVVASMAAIGPTTLDSHVKELCGSQPNSNAAGYGPCVATPFHKLDITGLTTVSSRRFAGVPFPLQVRKRDAYCQVMVTDSDSTVRLLSARDGQEALDTSVSLVGATAVMNKGIAVFEVAVKPTFASVDEDRATLLRQPFLYAEGTDAAANANMQSDVHKVFFAENRSVCPPGHVLRLDDTDSRAGPGACMECPQTTFSSHPLESRTGSCSQCPPGMVCGGGKDVKPLEEFWADPCLVHGNTSVDMYDPEVASASDRRATETVQIKAVRCAQGACLDNWGCREGHRGRLCGVCKDRSPNGNPYAMGANGCVECKESNKAVAWIIAILCIALALILYYLAVWRPLIKFHVIESGSMSCWKRVGDAAKSARASVLKCATRTSDDASVDMRTRGTMTAYLKVAVGFFQVTSSFLSNLEVDFPASLKIIMSVFSLFNLDFFSFPNTECLLSQMNHTTKVVLCTLFLIAVLLLLALPLACICASGADAAKKSNVVSAFYFSSMAFLFVFYPFVSKVIIETFICVDLGKNSIWLKSDLRERCPMSNSLGFVWSVIFTIAIPIGVPVLFLGLLFRFQIPWLAQYKMKMHRLKAVLEKMGLLQSTSPQFAGWQGTTEPVNLLSREQCTSVLAHDFVRDRTAAEFEGAMDALEDQLAGRISSTGAGTAGDAQVEVPEDESQDVLRRRTAEYVDKLTSAQIVSVPPVSWDGETGDVEQDAIEKCGFLFLTYKADCWWFEMFEMSRKVILSAVISFVSDPDVRLAVAYLISFGSLVVVVLARPFLNPSVNFFMTAALITQTLTLVYGLMLMVKKYAETQAVPKSEMNFFQEVIVLLNAVLFAIPLIEMFLRDVIVLLGGMMLNPVYSSKQQMAPVDDPVLIENPAITGMFLRDGLVTWAPVAPANSVFAFGATAAQATHPDGSFGASFGAASTCVAPSFGFSTPTASVPAFGAANPLGAGSGVFGSTVSGFGFGGGFEVRAHVEQDGAAMPSERESLLLQENLPLQEEIAKHQQELQR
jgi:N-acetylneuraminic acid mutarotase